MWSVDSVEEAIWYSIWRSVQGLSVYFSVINSMYFSICFFTDPPARCELLTGEMVESRIDELLTEDRYTKILKLDVEKLDEEDLRKTKKLRSESLVSASKYNRKTSWKRKEEK